MPNVVKKLRTMPMLWGAQAIDAVAGATMRSIRAVTDSVDPHPHREHGGTTQIDVGCSSLFIPRSTLIYIAASMVLHYIYRDQYRAPDEFCDDRDAHVLRGT
jgi:hypothetical protein